MDWLIPFTIFVVSLVGAFGLGFYALTRKAGKRLIPIFSTVVCVAIMFVAMLPSPLGLGGWSAINLRDEAEIDLEGCNFDRWEAQEQTIMTQDALAGTAVTSNSNVYVWDNENKFTLLEWHKDEYTTTGVNIDAMDYYVQLTTDSSTGKDVFEYDACKTVWIVFSEGQNKSHASPPTYFDHIESRVTKGKDKGEDSVDDLKRLKIYKVGVATNVSETTTLDISDALTSINPILAFKNATNNAALVADGYTTRIRVDKSTFASDDNNATGVSWSDLEFGNDWDELDSDDDEVAGDGDMVYIIDEDWYKKNNTLYGGVNGVCSGSFAIENLTYGAGVSAISVDETIAFSYYLEVIDGDGNCIYQISVATMTITAVA